MAHRITRRRLAGKHRKMPDLKEIQYAVRKVAEPGWEDPVCVENCERRWPGYKDRNSANVQIRDADLIWFAWTENLNCIEPKEGDRITFEKELWTVTRATEELIGQRWRIYCKKGVS